MEKAGKDIERNIYTIMAATILMLSGCAGLANLKLPGRTKELPLLPVVQSRIDSLAAAGISADTLILLKDDNAEIVRKNEIALSGQASVQVGSREIINGYRVQLASSEQSQELERLVQRVERELECKSYLETHAGRFYLRVGDFTVRKEAEELRKRAVSFGFRYAWVVQTRVLSPR